MQNRSPFSFILIASLAAFSGLPNALQSGKPADLNAPIFIAASRFLNNGDGTVTDTKRKLIWQRRDNGKEVTYAEAQEYCKTLRLGGYADWRLPEAEEVDTALAVELRMPVHSPDTYARFDLYWTSDPTVLIPFNYQPAQGKEVLRAYPARVGGKAFVRAVRSLATVNPDNES